MPIIKHVVSFGGGEISPLLDGRTDIAKYATGCRVLENFIPTPQGVLMKRPGLERLGTVPQEDTDENTAYGQLAEFQITTDSSVMLALGGRKMKFVNGGLMVKVNASPGAADFTLTIPWADTELRLLRWKQVNAVMWFVHPGHPPYQLTRNGSGFTDWTLEEIDFGVNVPLLDENKFKSRTITTSFNTDPAIWLGGVAWSPLYWDYLAGQVVHAEDVDEWVEGDKDAYLCIANHTLTATTPGHFRTLYTGEDYNNPAGKNWIHIYPYDSAMGGPGIGPGELAYADGGIYRCILAFATFTSAERPTTGANWALHFVFVGPLGSPGLVKVQGSYSPPARRELGGKSYRCILAHQAIATTRPSTGATWETYWEEVTVSYEAGDRVTHAGKIWVTRKDHVASNATEPGTGATFVDADGITRALWVHEYSDSASEVGQKVTLTANTGIFRTGHVGSTWEIAARRGQSKYEVSLAMLEDTDDSYSALLVVQGQWSFTTFGTWAGSMAIEISSDDGETWKTVRIFRSYVTRPRNASTDGYEDTRVIMRLKYLDWSSDTNASTRPYGLLSTTEGRIRGLVRITGYTSPTVVTGRCVSPVEKTTTNLHSEGAWSVLRGFPRCVEMHQNRLLMAGTSFRPHTIWGSASDDYLNFKRGTEADMSYVHTLAVGARDPILWMNSDKRLVVGNGAGEYTLRGETEEGPITPEQGVSDRHSSFGTHTGGAGHIVSDTVSLFVQNGGRTLREMAYSFQSDKYESGNLNLLAGHLFRDSVEDVAVQRQPFQILWVVAGGELFSLTYERSQDVVAWARHPVGGRVIAVGSVRRHAEDQVYFLVRRGSLTCIERLTPGGMLLPKDDGTWMDSHTRLLPAPAGEYDLSFHPLTGREVVVHEETTGRILGPALLGPTILKGVTGPVRLGLPYRAVVQPLTPEIGLANGSSRTRECRIHSIVPNLYRSRGGKFGETAGGPLDRLEVGAAGKLFEGEVEKGFDGGHGVRGNFCVVSDEPFPFTLRSVAVKLNYHGDAG